MRSDEEQLEKWRQHLSDDTRAVLGMTSGLKLLDEVERLRAQVVQWMAHGTSMQKAGHEMMTERDELLGLLRGLELFQEAEGETKHWWLPIAEGIHAAPALDAIGEALARYDAKGGP